MAAVSFGAEPTSSKDATTSDQSKSGSETTVEQELQKLFKQSGTPMPSFRKADLPYAKTPQMNRVRRREQAAAEQAPPEKKKKKNLLSRFFGRFRRDKSQDGETAVEEPAAVADSKPTSGVMRPIIARPSSGRRTQVQPTPATTAQSQSSSNARPSPTSNQERSSRTVQAVSQPRQSGEESRQIPRLDLNADDENDVIDPFGFDDAEFAQEEEETLDLDAVAEIPEVTSKSDAQPVAEASAEETPEPETNPFTGRRLNAEDEFADSSAGAEPDFEGFAEFFEAKSQDAEEPINREANPFFRGEQTASASDVEAVEESFASDEDSFEVQESTLTVEHVGEQFEAPAVQIIPRDSQRSVVEVPPAEPARGVAEWNPASEPQADDVSPEPTSTRSHAGWKTRLTSDDSSRSEGVSAPLTRTGRLASVDRVPAARTQALRWRQSESMAGTATFGKEPEAGRETESAPVETDSAEPTPQEARRGQIAARRHLTGFMGFCPVVLRDSRDLVDASDLHEAAFGLKTYQFSSDSAREQFEANPTRYAPAAGGADVVALVHAGEHHEGSLEFAMWYRDRLYLFQSRETMGLFRENPSRFADRY